ncbi:MAG: phosphoethanolamine transferase [Porphyromonadaceae bacterium]|nr:phosphoethanolamine transferase [Porphyromonadaceae bacterium]
MKQRKHFAGIASYLPISTRIIHEHIYVPVFSIILGSIINYRYLNSDWPIEGEYTLSLAGVFGVAMLTWGICALPMPRLMRRAVVGMILIATAGLFLTESFLLHTYQTVFTDSIALILLSTNPSELREFTPSLLIPSVWLIPLGQLLATSVAVYGLRFWLRRERSQESSLIINLIASGLLLFGYGVLNQGVSFRNRLYANDTEEFPIFSQMAPFERLYMSLYTTIEEKSISEKFLSQLKEISLEVTHTPLKKHNVVLIIGESLTKRYMHCYGYPLETTPHIDSLLRQGNLFLFTDVISPEAYTASSLSKVLTSYTNESAQDWYTFPTLPSVMSRAGYHTYWLSAQENSGLRIHQVVAISETSDETYFIKKRTTRDWWSPQKPAIDEEVLPYLHSCKSLPGEQSLLQIVHLMGSHPIFDQRYPEHYHPFSLNDLPERISPKVDQGRLDYIRSVHYNDSIVGQIINRYADEPSLIIYLSDHGYIVYDDPETPEQARHGIEAGGLEIPFMVYLSSSMQEMYPDLMKRIKLHQSSPIMTDLLPASLYDLLGIRTPHSDPRKSFFNQAYDTKRERIVEGFNK